MNRYESLFIVSPTLDAGQIGELTEGINTLIQDGGGNVLLTDHWAKRDWLMLSTNTQTGTMSF